MLSFDLSLTLVLLTHFLSLTHSLCLACFLAPSCSVSLSPTHSLPLYSYLSARLSLGMELALFPKSRRHWQVTCKKDRFWRALCKLHHMFWLPLSWLRGTEQDIWFDSLLMSLSPRFTTRWCKGLGKENGGIFSHCIMCLSLVPGSCHLDYLGTWFSKSTRLLCPEIARVTGLVSNSKPVTCHSSS